MLIKKLMQADVNNQPEKMHDIVVALILKKVITLFRLFHLENRLGVLNIGAEFHGDRDLVRWYLKKIIEGKMEKQSMQETSKFIRDILYVTSHSAWCALFSTFGLARSFPTKTFALCKSRTQKPIELMPL